MKLESLSFRDRGDILLEKKFSGVAEIRYTMLYGKSQFQIFFDAWRQGQIGPEQSMAIFKQDERSDGAQEFLLEASPIEEKAAAFKNNLGWEHLWFAEYIIGEHYLRDGKEKESLDAFENSAVAIRELSPDQLHNRRWLKWQGRII